MSERTAAACELKLRACASQRASEGTRGSGAWHVCRARVREVAHRRAMRCRAVPIKQSMVERPTQAAAVQCGRWWIRWPTHARRESTGRCAHMYCDAGEERIRPSRATERARVGAHLTCGSVSCERLSPWALCGFLSGTVQARRAQGEDDGRWVARALEGPGRWVVCGCGERKGRRDERKLVISRPRGGRRRRSSRHHLNCWDAARKAISPAPRAGMKIG